MRRVVIATLAYLLMVGINALANALPLNGQTTGEIANRLEVLFTPAGYVFSIWGLIYLLLGLWVFRQWFTIRSRAVASNAVTSQAVIALFSISCLLNSLWIVLWHYEYFLYTVIVMLGLLLTLIAIYTRVRRTSRSRLERTAFSVYLGWISVATIANISYFLVYIGWGQFGLSAEIWTLIMLVVALVLAGIIVVKYRDWVYAFVFVWAFIGIGVQNHPKYEIVALVAYSFAAVLFVFSVIYSWLYSRKRAIRIY